jgi:hypothetical protein
MHRSPYSLKILQAQEFQSEIKRENVAFEGGKSLDINDQLPLQR